MMNLIGKRFKISHFENLIYVVFFSATGFVRANRAKFIYQKHPFHMLRYLA